MHKVIENRIIEYHHGKLSIHKTRQQKRKKGTMEQQKSQKKEKKKDVISKPLPINNYLNVNQKA